MFGIGVSSVLNFGGACEECGLDNNVAVCFAAVDELFAVNNGLANYS